MAEYTSAQFEVFSKARPEDRKAILEKMPPESRDVFANSYRMWRGEGGTDKLGLKSKSSVTGVSSAPPSLSGGPVPPPQLSARPSGGLTPPPQRPMPSGQLQGGPQQSPGFMETLNMAVSPEGGRAAMQGFTGKYGDELLGASQMGAQKYGTPMLPFPLNVVAQGAEVAGVGANAIEDRSMAPIYRYMQGGMRSDRPAGQLYTESRDSDRQANQAAQQKNPHGYQAAEMLSGLPRYMATGGVGGTLLQGGAEGVGGSNNPINTKVGAFQTALEGGVGAAVAGAGYLTGQFGGAAVGGAAKAIMGRVDLAEKLVAAAIRSGRQELVVAAEKFAQETMNALKMLRTESRSANKVVKDSANVTVGTPVSSSMSIARPPLATNVVGAVQPVVKAVVGTGKEFSRAAEAGAPASAMATAAKLKTQVQIAKKTTDAAKGKLAEAQATIAPEAIRKAADESIKGVSPIRDARNAAVVGAAGASMVPGIGAPIGAMLGLTGSIIKTMTSKDPRTAAAVARTVARVTMARKLAKINEEQAGALIAGLTRGLVNNGSKGFFETWQQEAQKNPTLKDVAKLKIPDEQNMEKVMEQIRVNGDVQEPDLEQLMQLGMVEEGTPQ